MKPDFDLRNEAPIKFTDWGARRSWHVASELARHATQLIATAAGPALGELTAASPEPWDLLGNYMQIRSEPLGWLDGGEFRHSLPSNPRKEHLDILLDILMEEASSATERREEFCRIITFAGETARRAIASQSRDLANVPSIAAVGAAFTCGARSNLEAVVDVMALGHGLEPALTRIRARDREDLLRQLAKLLDEHRRRARMLGELRAKGASGRIEVTALKATALAGLRMDIVLARLGEINSVEFEFGEPGIRCLLQWNEGVIECGLSEDGGFALNGGCLYFSATLPETVRAALSGRRLGEIIGDHPLLPVDAVVIRVDETPGADLRIELDVPIVPLPDKTDNSTAGTNLSLRYTQNP